MTHLSEYDFDQMMAEAVHKIGADRVYQCVEPLARKYGWPIPVDKRPVVATVVAILVKDEENRRRT
jgi:hypothetical protein